jgi:hypothetical protein
VRAHACIVVYVPKVPGGDEVEAVFVVSLRAASGSERQLRVDVMVLYCRPPRFCVIRILIGFRLWHDVRLVVLTGIRHGARHGVHVVRCTCSRVLHAAAAIREVRSRAISGCAGDCAALHHVKSNMDAA